jgi:hypothetical protein
MCMVSELVRAERGVIAGMVGTDSQAAIRAARNTRGTRATRADEESQETTQGRFPRSQMGSGTLKGYKGWGAQTPNGKKGRRATLVQMNPPPF